MADYAYCSIQDVKDRLDIEGATGDVMLLSIVRAATRFIDQHYDRCFVPETATRRFDGSGARRLFIDDLLAVTSLVDDDDTWTTSDYLLYPRNAGGAHGPYVWIETDPDGDYSAFTGERDVVIITGRWGAYEETEDTGATLAAALAKAATTMTIATGSGIYPGHVLLIDSEQIFVTGHTTGDENDTYIVTRGVNGTTGAAHDEGAAINRYLSPSEIAELCVELAARLYKMKDTAYQDATASEVLGRLQYRRSAKKFLEEESPIGWYRSKMGAG